MEYEGKVRAKTEVTYLFVAKVLRLSSFDYFCVMG
jgi:hypothetical protein